MQQNQTPITVKELPKDLHRYLQMIKIPKKTGGVRVIYAPQEPLKSLQKLALQDLYKRRIMLPASITAYKRNCSAFTNANRHFGYKTSVKFDIKNYFDSITADNISVALRLEGIYSRTELIYLLQLSTLKNRMYQGSCLSPFLANVVSKHLLLPRLKVICYPYRLPIFTVEYGTDAKIHFIMAMQKTDKKWNSNIGISVFGLEGDEELCKKKLQQALKQKQVTTIQFLDKFTDEQLIETGNDYWRIGREEDSTYNYHYGYTNSTAYKGLKYALDYPTKLYRHKLGISVITIYSDDIVISSNNNRLNMIKFEIEKAIEKTGFVLNRKKGITVMRSNVHITGYNSSNRCKNATAARITNVKIDEEIRRPIHYIKIGKVPIDETLIRHLVGKICYIKQSNPNHYSKYLKLLKEIVSMKITDQSIIKLIPTV